MSPDPLLPSRRRTERFTGGSEPTGAGDDVVLTEQAASEAQRLEDAWRPVALELIAWLPLAKQAQRAQQQAKDLKAAEDWCKNTSGEIRDARFQPIADAAMAIWKTLRLRSNVDLEAVALTGASTYTGTTTVSAGTLALAPATECWIAVPPAPSATRRRRLSL